MLAPLIFSCTSSALTLRGLVSVPRADTSERPTCSCASTGYLRSRSCSDSSAPALPSPDTLSAPSLPAIFQTTLPSSSVSMRVVTSAFLTGSTRRTVPSFRFRSCTTSCHFDGPWSSSFLKVQLFWPSLPISSTRSGSLRISLDTLTFFPNRASGFRVKSTCGTVTMVGPVVAQAGLPSTRSCARRCGHGTSRRQPVSVLAGFCQLSDRSPWMANDLPVASLTREVIQGLARFQSNRLSSNTRSARKPRTPIALPARIFFPERMRAGPFFIVASHAVRTTLPDSIEHEKPPKFAKLLIPPARDRTPASSTSRPAAHRFSAPPAGVKVPGRRVPCAAFRPADS